MYYKRSITKAVVWEILSHSIGWTLIYLVTMEVSLATGVTLISIPTKIFFYTIHEKAWSLTRWGK